MKRLGGWEVPRCSWFSSWHQFPNLSSCIKVRLLLMCRIGQLSPKAIVKYSLTSGNFARCATWQCDKFFTRKFYISGIKSVENGLNESGMSDNLFCTHKFIPTQSLRCQSHRKRTVDFTTWTIILFIEQKNCWVISLKLRQLWAWVWEDRMVFYAYYYLESLFTNVLQRSNKLVLTLRTYRTHFWITLKVSHLMILQN